MNTIIIDSAPNIPKGTVIRDSPNTSKNHIWLSRILSLLDAHCSHKRPYSSPGFLYQCLSQNDLYELPQMRLHGPGPLPLLPLHQPSSNPPTSGILGCCESSLYHALAQLATSEEDRRGRPRGRPPSPAGKPSPHIHFNTWTRKNKCNKILTAATKSQVDHLA